MSNIFFFRFSLPPVVDSLLSLSLSVSLLVALSCTIFYIFMHDAFNHVMHMIFRRTLRPVPNLVPLLLCCIQFHQHELCLPRHPTPNSLLPVVVVVFRLSTVWRQGKRERESAARAWNLGLVLSAFTICRLLCCTSWCVAFWGYISISCSMWTTRKLGGSLRG